MTIVASNSLTLSKVNDGVGVTSTVITYANSTSGTTAPSTGWTSSVPSPVKGQYLWTKTVWTSTDTSTKTAYSVSYNSKDGTNGTNGTSGIIVSSVAPNSPKTGQLWQDTSTTPQLVKKWTGREWVIWELYVQNLKADTLDTISAKIGNIQNDFTLADGTTGTLHIGSSEYRIDSQIQRRNYLFKENVFFDPDGLSFDFDGDAMLNSGYGNYRKSGSDFYLQSRQQTASYTVSGISMSNEFAGYHIEIHDANNKLNFVSENGQGFDFTGPVSFNGIPMNTTSSTSFAIGYGASVTAKRVGDLVTITFKGSNTAQLPSGANPNEMIPLGYRPVESESVDFLVAGRHLDTYYYFDPDGKISYKGETVPANSYFRGVRSYFTNDPWPA